MKQDYVFSVLLHLAFIIVLLTNPPFESRHEVDLGEVINVRLTAPPSAKAEPPVAIEPLNIPAPVTADEPLAVVTDAITIDKAKKVDKPKPKPKEDKPYQPKTETGNKDVAGLEDGQKDISDELGQGSLFSGASIDNASFDYPYWFIQAFSKIERNWSNPIPATQPLKCVIYFQVIASGNILKAEIEQSSGIPAFDNACQRAVLLSNPLPQLPRDFVDEILGIHLEFPYQP